MSTSTATAVPARPGTPEFAEVLRRIAEGRRIDSRSHEGFAVVRESRLVALRLPVEDGGGGLSIRELFDAVIQLARADPDVAHGLRSTFGFVESLIHSQQPGLRERWVPLVRQGYVFGNATNELNGRTVGGAEYNTLIEPDGPDFRITGTKYYCTGSIYSDFIGVHVVDGAGELVRAVLPADRDGIEVIDDWDGIGQIHSGSGTVRFDGVLVHPGEIVPAPVEQAGQERTTGLAFAQLYLQAIMAGVLLGVEDDAVALVRGRARGFGHAPHPVPAHDPILQETVGEISSAAFVARAAVLVAAEALDAAVDAAAAGHPDAALVHTASLEAARVKVLVDRLATETATALFDVGGASATRRGLNLDRHWRNVRTLQGHNPRSYKAQAIGDHLINGVDLPNNAFF